MQTAQLVIDEADLIMAINALYDSANWHDNNSWITSGDDLRDCADRLCLIAGLTPQDRNDQ